MHDPIISEAFRIRRNNIGKIPSVDIDRLILEAIDIDSENLNILGAAFDSFTKIAIDQIHRTYRGNPALSREDAKKTLRECMFFLTDEVYEQFYDWADWCVAKGC